MSGSPGGPTNLNGMPLNKGFPFFYTLNSLTGREVHPDELAIVVSPDRTKLKLPFSILSTISLLTDQSSNYITYSKNLVN